MFSCLHLYEEQTTAMHNRLSFLNLTSHGVTREDGRKQGFSNSLMSLCKSFESIKVENSQQLGLGHWDRQKISMFELPIDYRYF